MRVLQTQYIAKGKTIGIRTAEPEDAAELIALMHQLDRETVFLAREPGEFDMAEEREREFLANCAQSEHCCYLVAVVDGKIVGNCNALFGTRKRYRHVADISVGLLKSHWGMRIGRMLLETCINWLKESGVEKVELAVDTQNLRAVSLYISLGFVVEGHIRHERKLADGTYRDAYRMELDLTNRKERERK